MHIITEDDKKALKIIKIARKCKMALKHSKENFYFIETANQSELIFADSAANYLPKYNLLRIPQNLCFIFIIKAR